MRAAWANALGAGGDVDVFSSFIHAIDNEGMAKLTHHVRYIERHFPGWSWSGLWGRWYGKYPRVEKDRAAPVCCPCCGQRFQYLDCAGPARRLADELEVCLLSGRPPPRYFSAGISVDERPTSSLDFQTVSPRATQALLLSLY